MSERCNGWYNYETWETVLEIDNDEHLSRYWHGNVSEWFYENLDEDLDEENKSTNDEIDEAISNTAKALEESLQSEVFDSSEHNGVPDFLVLCAITTWLQEIDYREIVVSWLEDELERLNWSDE
jgi:hypothetical protein